MILHTAQQQPQQTYIRLWTHKDIPYLVSLLSTSIIWEKIDHVIMAPHGSMCCMFCCCLPVQKSPSTFNVDNRLCFLGDGSTPSEVPVTQSPASIPTSSPAPVADQAKLEWDVARDVGFFPLTSQPQASPNQAPGRDNRHPIDILSNPLPLQPVNTNTDHFSHDVRDSPRDSRDSREFRGSDSGDERKRDRDYGHSRRDSHERSRSHEKDFRDRDSREGSREPRDFRSRDRSRERDTDRTRDRDNERSRDRDRERDRDKDRDRGRDRRDHDKDRDSKDRKAKSPRRRSRSPDRSHKSRSRSPLPRSPRPRSPGSWSNRSQEAGVGRPTKDAPMVPEVVGPQMAIPTVMSTQPQPVQDIEEIQEPSDLGNWTDLTYCVFSQMNYTWTL